MFPLEAPPDLADAYALEAPAEQEPASPTRSGFDPALSARYARRVRLGTIGAGAAGVGTALVGVGAVVITAGSLDCLLAVFGDGTCSDGAFVTGTALMGVGGVTVLVGGVVMFTGAIGAAYDGRALGLRTTPALGWLGVGLIAGGFALGVTQEELLEESGEPALTTAGGILALGGALCGALQFVQVREVGWHAGLVLVPVPGGLGVAGRLGGGGAARGHR